MTSPDGPDAWCYDALTTRSWPYGGAGELSVLRSLEVVWLSFDADPAVFANLIDGEQPLEDFLAGPPAVATPAASLAAAQAYVRATRTPGTSTWLALELGPGLDRAVLSLRVDGANPAACAPPGPASAGVYHAGDVHGGGGPKARREQRALVEPGAREVTVVGLVQVGGPQAPYTQVEARRTVTLARGEGRVVRCELAPEGGPTLVLTDHARTPAA